MTAAVSIAGLGSLKVGWGQTHPNMRLRRLAGASQDGVSATCLGYVALNGSLQPSGWIGCQGGKPRVSFVSGDTRCVTKFFSVNVSMKLEGKLCGSG